MASVAGSGIEIAQAGEKSTGSFISVRMEAFSLPHRIREDAKNEHPSEPDVFSSARNLLIYTVCPVSD